MEADTLMKVCIFVVVFSLYCDSLYDRRQWLFKAIGDAWLFKASGDAGRFTPSAMLLAVYSCCKLYECLITIDIFD